MEMGGEILENVQTGPPAISCQEQLITGVYTSISQGRMRESIVYYFDYEFLCKAINIYNLNTPSYRFDSPSIWACDPSWLLIFQFKFLKVEFMIIIEKFKQFEVLEIYQPYFAHNLIFDVTLQILLLKTEARSEFNHNTHRGINYQ